MGAAIARMPGVEGLPRGRLAAIVDRIAARHEQRLRRTPPRSPQRADPAGDKPPPRGGAAVAIDRPAVAEAAPSLERLAARLRDPGPLPAEALRQARWLTGDGAG